VRRLPPTRSRVFYRSWITSRVKGLRRLVKSIFGGRFSDFGGDGIFALVLVFRPRCLAFWRFAFAICATSFAVFPSLPRWQHSLPRSCPSAIVKGCFLSAS